MVTRVTEDNWWVLRTFLIGYFSIVLQIKQSIIILGKFLRLNYLRVFRIQAFWKWLYNRKMAFMSHFSPKGGRLINYLGKKKKFDFRQIRWFLTWHDGIFPCIATRKALKSSFRIWIADHRSTNLLFSLHCKYFQFNFYTFYMCPTFHCNITPYCLHLITAQWNFLKLIYSFFAVTSTLQLDSIWQIIAKCTLFTHVPFPL